MGADWFGNLQLAFKYALALGTLLVLTLVAGLGKYLYDRRRLKKLIQKDGESGARSDEEDLHMREKDEGDLFGVRALEAGFFGGVAQSRPTSVVNSPTSTPRGGNTPRSGSPAPSNRNSAIASRLPNNATGSRAISQASSSTLSLSHYGQRQSSADSIEPAPPRVTPGGLRQISTASDSGQGQKAVRKDPPAPVRIPGPARLQPSDAELNGRINHSGSVNMALEVPPSPVHLSPPHTPLHHEPTSSPDGQEQDTLKHSSSSSRYSWRQVAYSIPEALRPRGHGKTPVRVDGYENSHAQERPPSSDGTTSPTLPALPAKAAIGSSNPHPNGSRQESAAQSTLPLPIAEANMRSTGSEPNTFPAYHDATLSSFGEADDGPVTQHSDESSPRTSFSNGPAGSDYTGEAHRQPRPSQRLGVDIPMSSLQPRQYSNQASGHYVPAKPQRREEIVPSSGGKGGYFF